MKWFFAYLGDNEDFDPVAHAVEDEIIFGASIGHGEGEFSVAKIEVEAKSASYISLGRRAAIAVEPTGGPVTLLFIGNITSAPRAIEGEYVELEILSRMEDWEAAQAALIDAIAETPGSFDPLFADVQALRDPAEVLSGVGGFVNWDRKTGAPSLSMLDSGPRTLTFNRVDRDSVSLDVEAPPLKQVDIVVQASWSQDASVESQVVWDHGPAFSVIAHEALADAWPPEGVDIGGGWAVKESVLQLNQPRFQSLGEISGQYDSAIYSGDVPVYTAQIARVLLRNSRAQARSEIARVRVAADVQNLIEPATEEISVSLQRLVGEGDTVEPWQPTSSYTLGDIVFYSGALYECLEDHDAGLYFDESVWTLLPDFQGRIGTSFFETDRGQQALDYAIERAIARLRYRARAVRVSFDVPLEDAIDISLDDMATFSDPRLPGGTVTGKVISYNLFFDNGDAWATVEIGVSVGMGSTDEPVLPAFPGEAPKLGPTEYPSKGKVSLLAAQQIAELRLAPDLQSLDVRVEIDAPAVPSTFELTRDAVVNCGKIGLPQGIVLS
tara:strand:- start:17005 stop:18663 length:1659 start_codon:yes stop_codon:yes gene_type:complete